MYDRISTYFKTEWKILALITVSGLIYNLGLLAGPWFEGKMAGCLIDILGGNKVFADMFLLVLAYVISIAVVQGSRYFKRFYVRRFANNVNQSMKRVLYGSLIRKSRTELQEEGVGNVMTKAILDVDDCAEGMRKFTTEIFDTGVALMAYAGMLLFYDWKLAILSMIFPPISYFVAEKMKVVIQKTGAAYKKQSGALSDATLDRASNAITYRVFGREQERKEAYEENLSAYERAAVRANIWNSSMPPIYKVVSMTGVLFILYFGGKNVLGVGWRAWDIAAFTTFISCFTKLSTKSSSAAKLFNAVHKAQVSWKRIKPLMKVEMKRGIMEDSEHENQKVSGMSQSGLTVSHMGFSYPDGRRIFDDISFSAKPGQIIGITGPVACGKSTLGKVFLCESPYDGSIAWNGEELQEETAAKRAELIGYLGHDPELFNDTVEQNILMGDQKDARTYLKAVCFDEEVEAMEQGIETCVGSGGVRLSGGQAQRLALARTLCHKKKLLILDDPFSALDKKTEEQIFANLKEMAKDGVVLLISHRLYLFPQMDQVIWLNEGQVVIGSHQEVRDQVEEYRRLFDGQKGENQDEK